MNRIWGAAGAISLACVVLGAMLCLAERPRIRFGGPDMPQFSALAQTGPVGIAVSGNSRARRATYAPYLAQTLAPHFGRREPVIYDLSLPGAGVDAQLSMLIALIERRPVRAVIFQYYRRDRTHKRYYQIGTLHDILFAPLDGFHGIKALTFRTQLVYRRISNALDTCFADLAWCFKPYQRTPAVTWDDSWPREMRIEALQSLELRREQEDTDLFLDEREWPYPALPR